MKNKNIPFKSLFLLLLMMTAIGYLFSQEADTIAKRKTQFGFVLGYTTMHYRITPQIVDNGDGLIDIKQKPGWVGLRLGGQIKYKFNNHFSLVTAPLIIIGERKLVYTYQNFNKGTKIEKTYLNDFFYFNIPLIAQAAPSFMLKHDMYGNLGIGVMNDLNSINKKIYRIDQSLSEDVVLIFKRWDYAIKMGLGRKILDKKNKIFAEINFDYGLVNINTKKTTLNDAIKRLKSNVIGVSFVIN